ncbi:MAG: hypothetical protein EZS28_041956 [Streblomastix strix]|uniref:Uncharacterized protein n=1 Tax=Streblomastix strix TaxID=222440 RepID=A0A5J4TW36_9EUKA|nr:MAG: hypothetical protein EZS28_041956 [Streblomastix strix]
MRLNIQLDFETEERIVKFFIGKDIIEFVGVGIKKLPKDIKVVAMSQGSYKVYKSDNQERKGEEEVICITVLIFFQTAFSPHIYDHYDFYRTTNPPTRCISSSSIDGGIDSYVTSQLSSLE